MNIAQKIAKEATISFVGMGFGNTVRYIFTALLARWVGIEYLGIYSLGNAITRFAEVFGKAGLDIGILRYVSMHRGSADERAVRRDIRSTLKIGLVFSLIVMMFQIALSSWLVSSVFHGSPLLRTVIIVNAFSLPFTILTLIAAFATQGFKLLKYKIIVTNILSPLILLLAMVIVYFLFSSEMAIILPILISAIVSLVAILFFLRKLTGVHFSQIIPARLSTTILCFSYPLLFVSIIGTFMHWMDVMMLGYFTDTSTVGLYYPAARTAGLLRTIFLAFISIFAPMISELFAQEKQNEMNSLYQLVVRWIMTLAVPIMIILILFSKKVMMLFGGEYIQASNVLIVLTFATLIQAFIGAGGPALTMSGRPKVNLVNSVIVVVINVILNMLWIPKYEIMGAAWATFASLTILGLLQSFEVGFLIKLHPFTWKLIKPIIAGITTSVILYLVKPFIMPYHTVVTLLLAGLVTFSSFANVLWLMKFDSDDRDVWKGLLMIRKPSKRR